MSIFKRRPKPIQLESMAQLEELARSGLPVLVDFYQYGCGPCQIMDGIVNELADEFSGAAHVVKANVAYHPEAVAQFRIRSTPTFLLFTAPKSTASRAIHQRWRMSGLVKKDLLVKTLRSAVSPSG